MASMSMEQAFLDDILANPDDDVPRLVYADWLEEHGGPHGAARAEFIRVQCELARLPVDDDRRGDLESRDTQLLARYRKGWAGSLRHCVKNWEFHRGFVEAVKLPARTFLKRGKELFRLAPIRGLHLVNVADHAAALAESEYLQRIKSLTLAESVAFRTTESFSSGRTSWPDRQLAESVAFRTTENLRSILSSRHLTALRTLSLANYPLDQREVRLLAESASMAQIEALDLRNYGFGAGDVAALAGSPHLGRLRRLRLGSGISFNRHNLPREDSVGLLPRELAPLVGRLEFLDLDNRGITPAGLQLLGTVKRSVPLSTLLLKGMLSFTERGVRTMVQSPLLTQLHTIDLSRCYLDAACAHILADSPRQAGLVRLGLNNNPLGPTGGAALANSKHLNRLQRLELAHWRHNDSAAGDAGVSELANATGLPCLNRLDLRHNEITAKGLRALLASPLIERLYWLDLRHNILGNEGITLLLERGPWPRLAHLNIRHNGAIDSTARQALRARFGHLVWF
jgi:uncharacterized protein (TIGR02996 family)